MRQRYFSVRHLLSRARSFAAWSLLLLLGLLLNVLPGYSQQLGYHEIRTDPDGKILPWYSDDPATAYDFGMHKVWDFWRDLPVCCDGQKYYMISRVWDETNASYGVGGDQFAMALSSWSKLYAYTGDQRLVDNMREIADTYLQNSLSDPLSLWPNIPYPCNLTPIAVYDGDLVAGEGYTQPDKAGSFGAELITLYKLTGNDKYLQAAIAIANTLSAHMTLGDSENSPMPFRVHTSGGEVGDPYTTNWIGTMRLFSALIEQGVGKVVDYASADELLLRWLLDYPVRSNNWGPFYEDVTGWSNTQINACAFARYILEHPGLDSNWQRDARTALDWTYSAFADSAWIAQDVFPIFEQTVYMVPGNSHTSDYASAELLYAERTGDTSRVAQAVLQLNWATYMVDSNGMNRYPEDGVWFTDGYGDYVRYYLYSMASDPVLAPVDQPHILRTSSTISSVTYESASDNYSTFDSTSTELLRMPWKPASVSVDGVDLPLVDAFAGGTTEPDGWLWTPLSVGGTIEIHKSGGLRVTVNQQSESVAPTQSASLTVSYLAPDRLWITDLSPKQEPMQVAILNVLGNAILNQQINPTGSRSEIVLPHTADGMYFVRVTRGSESILQKIMLSAR